MSWLNRHPEKEDKTIHVIITLHGIVRRDALERFVEEASPQVTQELEERLVNTLFSPIASSVEPLGTVENILPPKTEIILIYSAREVRNTRLESLRPSITRALARKMEALNSCCPDAVISVTTRFPEMGDKDLSGPSP